MLKLFPREIEHSMPSIECYEVHFQFIFAVSFTSHNLIVTDATLFIQSTYRIIIHHLQVDFRSNEVTDIVDTILDHSGPGEKSSYLAIRTVVAVSNNKHKRKGLQICQ